MLNFVDVNLKKDLSVSYTKKFINLLEIFKQKLNFTKKVFFSK